jgi:hypothetical protein
MADATMKPNRDGKNRWPVSSRRAGPRWGAGAWHLGPPHRMGDHDDRRPRVSATVPRAGSILLQWVDSDNLLVHSHALAIWEYRVMAYGNARSPSIKGGNYERFG